MQIVPVEFRVGDIVAPKQGSRALPQNRWKYCLVKPHPVSLVPILYGRRVFGMTSDRSLAKTVTRIWWPVVVVDHWDVVPDLPDSKVPSSRYKFWDTLRDDGPGAVLQVGDLARSTYHRHLGRLYRITFIDLDASDPIRGVRLSRVTGKVAEPDAVIRWPLARMVPDTSKTGGA